MLQGLRLDPNANELSRLLAKANDQQAKRRMPQHASTLQLHRIQNNLLITQEPAAQLAAVIALRGWRVGYPQLSVGMTLHLLYVFVSAYNCAC